ncbi:hypothetical protein ACFE04_006956 [Oxalis oulophora]
MAARPNVVVVSWVAKIPLGSSLYASNHHLNWTSPNTLFAVAFISAPPPSSAFIAAVLYTGASPPLPIWSVAGKQVDSGGLLHFLPTGVLRLVNGSGATVWESPTVNSGVSSGSLDDSGNFLLNYENATVWSTFDNPTDTVIEMQNFTVGKTLKSGFYSFTLLKSGDVNLAWNGSLVYWTNEFNSSLANLASPRLVLQSNGKLSIFDKSLVSEVTVAFSNDFGEGNDLFRFWRLDSDGNLRIYTIDRGNGSLVERWAAVSDQCQVFGYCGNMGICSYNDLSVPICLCPSENFEFIDENDSRKGCRSKVELESCLMNSTMMELKHAKFLTYQLAVSQQYMVGIAACRSNCLGSSSCIASTSVSDGSGSCNMKTQGFISGYQSPALPSTSFVKICGTEMPNPMPIKSKDKCWRFRTWVSIFSVSAGLLMLFALIGGLWWQFCRHNPKYGAFSAKYMILEYASGVPVQFSLSAERNWKKFSLWAYEEFEKGNIEGLIDERLADDSVNMEQVMRAIQEQPLLRPTMGRIVQMLEGIVEIERPPSPMAVSEESIIISLSRNAIAHSSSSVSGPIPSSTSSVQNAALRMDMEKAYSSLLSDTK